MVSRVARCARFRGRRAAARTRRRRGAAENDERKCERERARDSHRKPPGSDAITKAQTSLGREIRDDELRLIRRRVLSRAPFVRRQEGSSDRRLTEPPSLIARGLIEKRL